MSAGARRALVLGTGVSGLTCALRLSEAGFDVDAWERRAVEHEVSSVAAAIWYPYKAGPEREAHGWALHSFAAFERLADDPASGVRMRAGSEWFPEGVDPPGFLPELPGARAIPRADLPPGFARGFEFRVPVVDTGVYLGWLRARCAARGVRFERREARALDEALDAAPLVVNCTGLASRELCGDRALVPVRGQVVCVAAGATERFLIDEHGPAGLCYVVPRGRDLVLGGSAVEGREDLAPDADETAAIVARAAAHLPALRRATPLAVKVGLRPCRERVRLEAETPRPGRRIVHDYGHGGAGVTLSWGCADEVVRLALS